MNIRMLCKLTIQALAWFILPAGAHAATTCAANAASLHGWYSLLISGQAADASTAKYEVGAVFFDGAKNISGNNIYGSGPNAGTVASAAGTYVQSADCTFIVSLTVGSVTSTYSVAVNNAGQAVGIETDAAAIAKIYFKPQYPTYVPVQNFNASSLNGTYAADCIGPLSDSSDLNLLTFTSGVVSGTDPYNNGSGNLSTGNNPGVGTYTVNSDGTFAGTVSVGSTTPGAGAPFYFYGVIDSSNKSVEYIYANVGANNAPTASFISCSGSVAPTISTAVNLAPYYNVNALVSDGQKPSNGGLAYSSYTYSATLLGSSITWNGLVFPLGPANLPSAVTNKTIPLPSGTYSTLNILGSGLYGPQTGTIVVTYTDGSKSTFTQTFSDWSLTYEALKANTNEAIAAATPYRVTPSGSTQGGPWYVFGYSFALSSKPVASVTLPSSGNIVILSAVLKP